MAEEGRSSGHAGADPSWATAGPRLTFAATYLRHIAELLDPEEVPTWLGRGGLDTSMLDDGALTLTVDTFAELMLDAMTRAQEPAMGLFLGERLIARTHGFVGYAALHSRSLREVLTVLERFVAVRLSLLSVSHRVHGDEAWLEVAPQVPLGRVQRPLLEAVLLSLRNILDAVSMGAFEVRALAFPFAEPEYAALARDIAGTPVRYDQPWAGLALRADALDLPLEMADPAAFEEAAQICERRLAALEASETTAGKVRRMLFRPASGFPSLPIIARRLHMSSRTLHRRLVAEGTSYRALVDEVRYRLAADHLTAGRARVDEIAFMLGYTDPANFRRAFRRWSGRPPSEFRSETSSQPDPKLA